MKANHTEIVIVLDRSGSMGPIAADTIGGYNKFLEDQKASPGTANLTLHQFDNEFITVSDRKPISSIEPLTNKTFVPRGSTALLDAIGRAITQLGSVLAILPEEVRAEKVVVVVITDGEENASREYSREMIFDMINHQKTKYNWQFVFLGADQDAIKVGGNMGFSAANNMTYAKTSFGTQSAFKATSKNLSAFRSSVVQDMSYTDEDRKEQEDAGAVSP